MADLKYLGFVIALAAYAQGWFDTALEVYSTGRKFLPGVADTVLQSAEDVSVTLFLFFVAPVVSKTRKTATTILEWIDEKAGGDGKWRGIALSFPRLRVESRTAVNCGPSGAAFGVSAGAQLKRESVVFDATGRDIVVHS